MLARIMRRLVAALRSDGAGSTGSTGNVMVDYLKGHGR